MDKNPSSEKGCGINCPVEMVSWDDVQEYIKKLNENEGTDKYRLPTEAEWEYACRAGTSTAFPSGKITGLDCELDPNLDPIGWYCYNSGNIIHPVAQKKPNVWGLYDMTGNVQEWCQDQFGPYPWGEVTDPKGPAAGTYRVMRGGHGTALPANAAAQAALEVHRTTDSGISVSGFAERPEKELQTNQEGR